MNGARRAVSFLVCIVLLYAMLPASPPQPPSPPPHPMRNGLLSRCTEGPRFAYLLTTAASMPTAYGDYDAMNDARHSALFLVTWARRAAPVPAAVTAARFQPNATFSGNRNTLLRMATRHERMRGCRFDFYVFVDDHLRGLVARWDLYGQYLRGLNVTNASLALRAFERVLLAHRPCVGVPDYLGWRVFGRRRAFIELPVNFDHAFIAVDSACARLLLPYAAAFDRNYQSQQLLDMLAALWFHERRFMLNAFELSKVPHASSPGFSALDPRPMLAFLRGALPAANESAAAARLQCRALWPLRRPARLPLAERPACLRNNRSSSVSGDGADRAAGRAFARFGGTVGPARARAHPLWAGMRHFWRAIDGAWLL
jgi:hypothetical protein